MEPERLDQLGLGPMVEGGTAETNFTVSIDLEIPGSTGISAADRARTVRRAIDPASSADEFRRPGHMFPLRYTEGGVLARRGHTEASVDLARLAGRQPSAVICEIMNDDGTMARAASVDEFACRHGLLQVSIEELVAYVTDDAADHGPAVRPVLVPTAVDVERVVTTVLPTRFGRFETIGFRSSDGLEYVLLSLGTPGPEDTPLVRVHSECLTGDALGSERCDCGRQLEMALEEIRAAGAGIVIYVRGHEGRGIGLLPKLQAYALQDRGRDTVDANLELGYEADSRTYEGAAGVLKAIGIRSVRLLTNNPRKIAALEQNGVSVIEQIPIVVPASIDNIAYLSTKRNRLQHSLPAPFELGDRQLV
jgi:3,4-dihydroxy 2-butanone 4-phosphate synthase / GTP cyclohydrolase II